MWQWCDYAVNIMLWQSCDYAVICCDYATACYDTCYRHRIHSSITSITDNHTLSTPHLPIIAHPHPWRSADHHKASFLVPWRCAFNRRRRSRGRDKERVRQAMKRLSPSSVVAACLPLPSLPSTVPASPKLVRQHSRIDGAAPSHGRHPGTAFSNYRYCRRHRRLSIMLLIK